jgi:choline-glycine betaine transporter
MLSYKKFIKHWCYITVVLINIFFLSFFVTSVIGLIVSGQKKHDIMYSYIICIPLKLYGRKG